MPASAVSSGDGAAGAPGLDGLTTGGFDELTAGGFGPAFDEVLRAGGTDPTRRSSLPALADRLDRAVGRPDEKVVVTTLDVADPERADMATLIIIGSAETRVIARASRPPLVYTPRTIESVGA